jgi:hypothetical protein
MNTKTAYQFDAAGLLVGVTDADESPMEEGVFLLPAFATFTVPPPPVDGQWPRWNGTAWQMVNKPSAEQTEQSALSKLQAFLRENPEVAALIGTPSE